MTPDEVLQQAATTRRQAWERQQAIEVDERYTPAHKREQFAALKEATNARLAALRRQYGQAIEETRIDLERGLQGDLRWVKKDSARQVLLQAEGFASNPATFQRAVARSQALGDNEMLDALTYVARDNSALRAALPEDYQARYKALDDFNQDNANLTRRMAGKMTLSEWGGLLRLKE